MAQKQTKNQKLAPKKLSKRQKRTKVMIYVMVIAMLLSTLTAGLSFLL